MSRPEPLPTRFDPEVFENAWYRRWEESGAFTPDLPSDKPPFVILIPPPNVTGKLHIGHALQFTLQDLVIRWRRMQGHNALWLPGTDHAGIATQMMVERELVKEGTDRHALGRERFLERVWAWKHQYKDNISRQARALGASCDWTRERFTLDDMLSQGGTPRVRPAPRRGPDLPRSPPDQLVPAMPHRALRPRDGAQGHRRRHVGLRLPGRGGRGDRRLHDAPGDDARRHGDRRPPGGRALPGPRRQAGRPPAARAGASRSWPTRCSSIPRSAPARSR